VDKKEKSGQQSKQPIRTEEREKIFSFEEPPCPNPGKSDYKDLED